MNFESISKLSDFCVGCGACEAICPQNAISFANTNGCLSLKIDKKKCGNCGSCLNVCPIIHAAFHKSAEITEAEIVGKYQKIFIAYASDAKIRCGGASGGVITALVMKMLKAQHIDGALVSQMKMPNAISTNVVKTETDLFASRGSIYFPTYTARQIKNIATKDGSYLIIGLPCHIAAFRRSEKIVPNLSNKIFAYFGLFCYHTNELWYLDYFIKKIAEMKLDEVSEVDPRRDGWPGLIKIKGKRGQKKIPFFSFWSFLQLLYFTSPRGCLFCGDHTNTQSDLSFGDAWLPSLMKKDEQGTSIVIARTKKGLSLLRDAEADGLIVLKETTLRTLLESQQSIFYKKKFVSATRRLIQKQIKISPKIFLELLPLVNANLARNRFFRNLLYALPKTALAKYAHLFQKLNEEF